MEEKRNRGRGVRDRGREGETDGKREVRIRSERGRKMR